MASAVWLLASARARPARTASRTSANAAIEDGLVELGLAAEEVAGRAPDDAGGGADLVEAGRVVSLFGEQPFGRIEDGRSRLGRRCVPSRRGGSR